MADQHTHQPVYLKDYRPPDYLIKTVDLRFELADDAVTVTSKLSCLRNACRAPAGCPLVLQGRELQLRSIRLDDRPLLPSEYKQHSEGLTIFKVPESFTVEIVTEIYPQKNTTLEGLYRSSGNFCTQCEAEGFRKITYFIDRPDVMAVYTTTLAADQAQYPVLLANGNLTASGELPGGRHYATWHDPFPKPSYLFALVAGNLVKIEDSSVTGSGRPVALQIYVEPHNREKCGHAMQSLKKAMRWDEETFGLEYDLDRYMIVAVDDFNMGAMENKGLNIFNSKYVLARPETATDSDYEHIEAVIGHEYFHNWTGNRVTCRDWFQLSLKEGLTVFRDQQFSAAMTSPAVKRIQDVRVLRSQQFAEDNGPMAHPVRPASYIEINNFYTVTVYEKGAELIRMIHTLLGPETFRKGMTLYLSRHDGHAATTDDFVQAMADASGRDLRQFRLWYSQAGTPRVSVVSSFDGQAATYTLTIRQSCPPTPGQPEKEPMHIPVAVGLLGPDGRDLPLDDGQDEEERRTTRILEVRSAEQEFRFSNVTAPPVPSLLRGFSAPVKLEFDYSDAELRFLLAHDADPFNRWEAGQQLACRVLLDLIARLQREEEPVLDPRFVAVMESILADAGQDDKAFVALLLTLPDEAYLAELMEVVDVVAIHTARRFVRRQLAGALRELFLSTYQANRLEGAYRYDPRLAGQRRLKNLCLSYLMALADDEAVSLCAGQYQGADNMTDVLSALTDLAHSERPEKEEALADFASRWEHDPLVMDKWFAVQATAPLPDTLQRVKDLMTHRAFSIKNPNRVRALIGAFAGGNPFCFHAESGEGYVFLADQVLGLNAVNPQVAARLAAGFSRWRRFDPHRQQLMQKELERLARAESLSRDVYEVVVKSLN